MNRLGIVMTVSWIMGLVPFVHAQTLDIHGRSHLPPTLGRQIDTASYIAVLEVEKVDRLERKIYFKKIADLKEKYEDARLIHEIPLSEPDRDSQALCQWAQPGQKAICFYDEKVAYICIGNFWYLLLYRSNLGSWEINDFLPQFLATYAGSVDNLREVVVNLLDDKEQVITTVPAAISNSLLPTPAHCDWLRGRKGRVCRIKMSLNIFELPLGSPELSRHFVGWSVGGKEVVPSLLLALEHKNPWVRAEAAVDLGQLGPAAQEAIPALRQALNDEDGHVRIFAAEALVQIDPREKAPLEVLKKALQSPEVSVRRAAADIVGALGDSAHSAIPTLVALLDHDSDAEVRQVAAFVLGKLQREAGVVVPALAVRLCQDPDPFARFWAARALLSFGPEARPALPALRAALRDDDDLVQTAALDVLARFGPGGLPTMMEGLIDPKCQVQFQIIEYLPEMGLVAQQAVPNLLEQLRDEEKVRRICTARILMMIDKERYTQFLLPVLTQLANQQGYNRSAIKLLSELGPEAGGVVPVLAKLLKDRDDSVRSAVAEALEKIGPQAQIALPSLLEALRDKSIEVRVAAARALWRLGHPREALATLLEASKDKDDWVRRSSLKSLAEMGPEASPALPFLQSEFRRRQKNPCALLALTIWQLEQKEEAGGLSRDLRQGALRLLIDMLTDKDGSQRASAAEALGRIGPEARSAVPHLIRIAQDKKSGAQDEAIGALGLIGPEARAAVPALKAALHDESILIRVEAAVALGRIERGSPEAIAALVQIYESGYHWDIGISLGDFGPEARAVVPALLRALRHEQRTIYLQAAVMLRKIDPEASNKAGVP